MKFFHLADLHIGKKVNGFQLLAEQKHALDQVLRAIDAEKPDALLLAGDLYDRRNPGVEAVDLMDYFFSEVVLERKTPVFAIGGNHDSGERLNFANGILAKAGLHLVGALEGEITTRRLWDEDGPVDIHLLPYADLPLLQHVMPSLANRSYSEAMAAYLECHEPAADARHVLLAHGVVLPPHGTLETCDSERDLFIGGAEHWSSESLSAYHYVALGHLHRMQSVGSPRIRYAGSLLKYSFSEENHQKAVQVVELGGEGEVFLREIPLRPLRDMRTVKGTLDELLEAAPNGRETDYIRVYLTDRGEVHEPMARLRENYPNIMTMIRTESLTRTVEREDVFTLPDDAKTPLAQLERFYQTLTAETPSEDMRALMQKLLEEVNP